MVFIVVVVVVVRYVVWALAPGSLVPDHEKVVERWKAETGTRSRRRKPRFHRNGGNLESCLRNVFRMTEPQNTGGMGFSEKLRIGMCENLRVCKWQVALVSPATCVPLFIARILDILVLFNVL